MQNSPNPHVSPALAHLRRGVTFCALIVAACAVVQLLIFGFVHFTQVRFTTITASPEQQSLSVVSGSTEQPAKRPAAAAQQPGSAAPAEPAPVVRQLSGRDASLHVISDMAVMAGVVATTMLAILVGLGVAIAAGACVPGLDRAVSSMSWSLLLALSCIPWRDFFLAVPFPGVFGSYLDMTSMSDAVNAGTASTLHMLVLYLLMPLAAFGAAVLALGRFRAGVAAGVIVTSVSELDEHLEREMAGIRSRGIVASGTSRAVGALNQAIGETPAPTRPIMQTPESTVPAAQPQPAAAPEHKGARGWLTRHSRRIGEPDAGDGLRRPL